VVDDGFRNVFYRFSRLKGSWLEPKLKECDNAVHFALGGREIYK